MQNLGLTASVKTFGCQMNARESEIISEALYKMGFDLIEDEKNADVVIYNTCTIRAKAEARIMGRLASFKNKPASQIIAVCGCAAARPEAQELLRKFPFVNLIFGTSNKLDFIRLLENILKTPTELRIQTFAKENGDFLETPILGIRAVKHKASVIVAEGCDNFCSYCIVPYVKGRERKRPYSVILDEVRALASDGAKEICLLGQNVNSYVCPQSGADFADLIRGVAAIHGLLRLRFVTSHPKDLSNRLIDAIRENPNVARHIHLPLQSGSSKILKKMNRKYDKETYLERAAALREIPDFQITTDIIIGFPGETDEDFLETCEVLKQVKFSGAFTFIYSPREGTPAAKEPPIPPQIARERFDELIKILRPIEKQVHETAIGRSLQVLTDAPGKRSGEWVGRSHENFLTHFSGESEVGKLENVLIKSADYFYLTGIKK